jgi:4-hydroxybenzoate polyprenyltransferase/phosphoserine phosphatase
MSQPCASFWAQFEKIGKRPGKKGNPFGQQANRFLGRMMRDSSTADRVLAVDLDGTLIRGDMLYECLWCAMAQTWRTPFVAAKCLAAGKPALKRAMAELGQVDVASLPYDPQVIAQIKAWRADGGRTALITASDHQLAEAVAAHLGLFDEVQGTTQGCNLKGEAKAALLADRYGAGGFVYIGDARADLPCWAAADAAITVGASPKFRAEVAGVNADVTHLSEPEALIWPVLKAMRPHQWLKNILVFVPVLANQSFTWAALMQGLMAFVAFGLVASAGYLLNDLLDLGPDRAHDRKRFRPLASGRLPVPVGTAMVPVLLAAGLLVASVLGWGFAGVIAVYFFMTMSYSLFLKRKAIIDICVLAGLYTLRIIAGGVATGIELSIWLLAFSLFFFFSLAAVKRQAELVHVKNSRLSGAAGRGYSVEDLPLMMQMALTSGFVSVLVMALYLNTPEVQAKYSAPSLLWGVNVLLLYWISRVVLTTHRGGMDDDPLVYAVTDRTSLIVFGLIGALGAGAILL